MIGLQIPYRDNEDIRKLVRHAAALPLVPENQVEDAVDLFTLAGQESIYNWIHNPIYLYVNGVYLMED
jgi:hypothetical protein